MTIPPELEAQILRYYHVEKWHVGMTGIIGGPAGYHAILDCDVLLLLGADFA